MIDRVDDDGFAKPAVNPLKHLSREPTESSPEGASFLLMLGSAWRGKSRNVSNDKHMKHVLTFVTLDCVCAGVCSVPVYD